MAGSEILLRGVILLQDPGTSAAVHRLLYRAGFGSPAESQSLAALEADLVRLRSDVVVVDLCLCGIEGMNAVASLTSTAQDAAVVAIVPFDGLRQPALLAGAAGAATPSDLRPLVECLDSVRVAAHAGLVCDCCRRRPAARRRPPPSWR